MGKRVKKKSGNPMLSTAALIIAGVFVGVLVGIIGAIALSWYSGNNEPDDALVNNYDYMTGSTQNLHAIPPSPFGENGFLLNLMPSQSNVYDLSLEEVIDYEAPEQGSEIESEKEPESVLPDLIEITPITAINSAAAGRNLELSVVGATGWAGARIELLSQPRLFEPPQAPVDEIVPEESDINGDPDGSEQYLAYEYEYEYEHEYEYGYDSAYGDDEHYQQPYSLDEIQEYYYPPTAEAQAINPYFIRYLEPGQVFSILEERGDWWRIRLPGDSTGWVLHEACFINLPDVIPSIVFNISNARNSLFISGGYDIPNVSGMQLYSAWSNNPRFGYEMYIVPTLYSTSMRLFRVQQAALYEGRTLVVYEIFRPRATQLRVVAGLQNLMRENDIVNAAINTPPWSAGWFISHGISLHQLSTAVDVSLARVVSYDIRSTSGGSQYRRITEIAYYEMPTQMHDLHPGAASLVRPGSSELAPTMTEGAILLRNFFTRFGFNPVASEWWHFSDMQGAAIGRAHNMTGDFFTEQILSFPPPR